jgi:hypothetical protein
MKTPTLKQEGEFEDEEIKFDFQKVIYYAKSDISKDDFIDLLDKLEDCHQLDKK